MIPVISTLYIDSISTLIKENSNILAKRTWETPREYTRRHSQTEMEKAKECKEQMPNKNKWQWKKTNISPQVIETR